MSNTSATLQDVASVEDFLNVAATETVPLFQHLEFEFLLKYDVFAPSKRGRTRVHQPPDLFRGFLHCYYKDIYGTRPGARDLQHGLVWYYCGLDKPPSRDTIDRFLTDLEHVVDDIFGRLDVLYRFDAYRGDSVERRCLMELPSNSRRVLLRLRLYDCLNRRKNPNSSGVHTDQTSRPRDGDTRHT